MRISRRGLARRRIPERQGEGRAPLAPHRAGSPLFPSGFGSLGVTRSGIRDWEKTSHCRDALRVAASAPPMNLGQVAGTAGPAGAALRDPGPLGPPVDQDGAYVPVSQRLLYAMAPA